MKITVVFKDHTIATLNGVDSYVLDAMHDLTYLIDYKINTLHNVYGVSCSTVDNEEEK